MHMQLHTTYLYVNISDQVVTKIIADIHFFNLTILQITQNIVLNKGRKHKSRL